jgi:hypothetical protein
MAGCEANHVDFLFGLVRNPRLEEAIKAELSGTGEHPRRQAGAVLHLVDAGAVGAAAVEWWARRGDPRRCQSTVCRHLAEASRGRRAVSLRDGPTVLAARWRAA